VLKTDANCYNRLVVPTAAIPSHAVEVFSKVTLPTTTLRGLRDNRYNYNDSPPLLQVSEPPHCELQPRSLKVESPKSSLLRTMSLVGLKNLFFRQTITPLPVRTKSQASRYDWSNGSNQPLLPAEDRATGRLPKVASTEERQINPNGSDDEDLESQSPNSKAEKALQKKCFRVDARVISDATIGLSDGLTVPFALTAGLSALGNTRVVIYGGFAELIAGAISMGLGGYLGAKSEA
jgi:hypothetical protein